MKKKERQKVILDVSLAKNRVTLDYISKQLDCSPRTIQRDIHEMNGLNNDLELTIKDNYIVGKTISNVVAKIEFTENEKIELAILLSKKTLSKTEISELLYIPLSVISNFFESAYFEKEIDIKWISNRTRRMRIYKIMSKLDQVEYDIDLIKAISFLRNICSFQIEELNNKEDKSIYVLIYNLNPKLFEKEKYRGNELRYNDFYNSFNDDIAKEVEIIIESSIEKFFKQEGFVFEYTETDIKSISRHISSVVDNYLSLGYMMHESQANVFQIKTENFYSTKLTEIITKSVERQFNIKISIEDVSYLYIHFSILMKSKNHVKACLVDKYNNHVSEYVINELYTQFSELSNIDSNTYEEYKMNKDDIHFRYDIKFTTYKHLSKEGFIILDMLYVNNRLITT
ncbi:MAG: helix-turn-helix domain-containing protein, partial [Bacilli bacterium]